MYAQLLSILSLFATAGHAVSGGNDTACAINVPGYSHHGDCNLLCAPASWKNMIVFFLGNYVAHAVTVITHPGETLFNVIITTLFALFFPSGGMIKALKTISTGAVFAPTELEKAARAGALITVVKRSEVPHGLREDDVQEGEKIHGTHALPDGYFFRTVPQAAKFEHKAGADNQTTISKSHNIPKIVIAAVQLGFSISTLYSTRGDQLNRYGYAAFGLTVAPYAWMSLVNVVASLISPQYSSMFLVGSQTLDDLKADLARRGEDGRYPLDGTVGRITAETEQSVKQGRAHLFWAASRQIPLVVATIAIGSVPLAVVGAISRFNPGGSALYQRVWVMLWMVSGVVWMPVSLWVGARVVTTTGGCHDLLLLFIVFSFCPVAIGGFVVVGQMLAEYGVCEELS